MSFIALRSGRVWHHFDPVPEDVDIEDVAHSLAMQCRWIGHTRTFYSIATHSLHVCDLVSATHPELAMAALLHDAAEAYYGDVASPFKRRLPDYQRAIALGENVVAEALGVSPDMHPVVKAADIAALGDEARDMIGPVTGWTPPAASGRECVEESWYVAKSRFLSRYYALRAGRAA